MCARWCKIACEEIANPILNLQFVVTSALSLSHAVPSLVHADFEHNPRPHNHRTMKFRSFRLEENVQKLSLILDLSWSSNTHCQNTHKLVFCPIVLILCCCRDLPLRVVSRLLFYCVQSLFWAMPLLVIYPGSGTLQEFKFLPRISVFCKVATVKHCSVTITDINETLQQKVRQWREKGNSLIFVLLWLLCRVSLSHVAVRSALIRAAFCLYFTVFLRTIWVMWLIAFNPLPGPHLTQSR